VSFEFALMAGFFIFFQLADSFRYPYNELTFPNIDQSGGGGNAKLQPDSYWRSTAVVTMRLLFCFSGRIASILGVKSFLYGIAC
jgi:hypothetical protein